MVKINFIKIKLKYNKIRLIIYYYYSNFPVAVFRCFGCPRLISFHVKV
jgi:hypothetical protein